MAEQSEHIQQIDSPEWLSQPDINELAALPAVPYKVSAQDETLFVTERPPANNPFIRNSDRPLYTSAVPTVERQAELDQIARFAGYDTILDLAADPVLDEVKANLPPYLTRRVEGDATAMDLLREMRRAALEELFAHRALAIAKERIAQKLPQLVPKEDTVVLVEERNPTLGSYIGRFGGQHLVQLLGSNITPQDIDKLNPHSEVVEVLVHELFHQKHHEVQGASILTVDVPDATPFNQIITTDPWEVRKLATQYWSEYKEPRDDTQLRFRLCSHLNETVAYLGEAEIKGELTETRFTIDGAHGPEWDLTEHTWITTFAAMTPIGQRGGIIEQLMHVDFRRFADLSTDKVVELIHNPSTVLQYVNDTEKNI